MVDGTGEPRRISGRGFHSVKPALAVRADVTAAGWSTASARGQNLRAGSIVLSGGLTAPVPLEPGTVVTAEVDGLGSIEVFCR
jgi:2-keto-4-pentenoate hydratase